MNETVLRDTPDCEPARPHDVRLVESLAGRQARTLKHGDTFSLVDASGDIRAGTADGLYHLDTRHLSRFDVTIDGVRPILLSSTLRDDNASLTCDLTNPELGAIRGDTLHLRRTQFLWQATLHERLRLRNFGDRRVAIRLEIGFEADFADIFEIRGTVRARRGEPLPLRVEAAGVTCFYRGLDGRVRTTAIRFDPAPDTIAADGAVFAIALDAGEAVTLFLQAEAGEPGRDAPPGGGARFHRSMRGARRALRRSAARAASVETSNEIFNEAIRRSVADIAMLTTDTPQGPYPYAGVPWFSTAFGRDALVTAFETLWLDPALARGVLGFLAANQAADHDPRSDAEPGKILHEVRRGEMAETGEVPFRRYYGSVDATPLFVMLAGAYLDRTGDRATIAALWPNLRAALGWMERHGDRDGDGFLEYGRMTEAGLANQGWKDSHDSVFHADGRPAEGPIALAEVQGYAYAARVAAARMAGALGDGATARAQAAAAETLRARFDAAFWCAEIGSYALALDGAKRPCRVRASNAGHALWTGIALPGRARVLARTLMAAESFSGWGVRTVAAGEARYNPMSYHNGSVWPHDNALIALGLARYGFREAAARVFDALFHASIHTELRRLPELFCGFVRSRGQGPTFYPVACIPQAWAAAAPLALIEAVLGLRFDAAGARVVLAGPVLPPFLDEMLLRDLRLGGASLDILVRRTGAGVAVSVPRRAGTIGLVTA